MKDPDLELIAEQYEIVCELIGFGDRATGDKPTNFQGRAQRQLVPRAVRLGVGTVGTNLAVKQGAARLVAKGIAPAVTGGVAGIAGGVAGSAALPATIGSAGAGVLQNRAMDKAVAAGQITPQAAAAELAASAKPKGDRKTKLIKSAVKPARESTDINKMSKIYMEQMVNPNQITAELVQYALSDPAALEQLLGVVPSLGTHPDIVAAQQQAMMQQQAMQQQAMQQQAAVPGAGPAAVPTG